MRRFEQGDIAAGGIMLATVIGMVAYTFQDKVGQIAEIGKEKIGLAVEAPATPTTEASDGERSTCTDIRSIPLEDKIGALIIPMAMVTELDSLNSTLLTEHISNFTFITEDNNPLTDTVQFGGQSMQFGQAIASIEDGVLQQNQVRTTFALDEEGGDVQRSKSLSGFNALPSAQQQSSMPNETLRTLFEEHGRRLGEIGVDLVFAPVADVGQQGAISSRSYSSDPIIVADKTGAVIDGYRDAGINTTAKHAPGLGTVSEDTHFKNGATSDITQMESTEVPVFRHLAVEKKVENMMVSHASTDGLTEPGQPASMSAAVYEYIRGEKVGFNGVIITDALNMKPVQDYLGIEDVLQAQEMGAVTSLNAGTDMVIVSLDAATGVADAIEAQVKPDRIDEAAARVMTVNKGYEICGY